MPSLAEEFRSSFPIFQSRVSLNSCSQGALSHQVRSAYESFLDGWEREGAQWVAWVERNELVRNSWADLVNAPSDAGSTQPGFTLWPAQSPGTSSFETANGGTEYFLSSNAGDEAQIAADRAEDAAYR